MQHAPSCGSGSGTLYRHVCAPAVVDVGDPVAGAVPLADEDGAQRHRAGGPPRAGYCGDGAEHARGSP